MCAHITMSFKIHEKQSNQKEHSETHNRVTPPQWWVSQWCHHHSTLPTGGGALLWPKHGSHLLHTDVYRGRGAGFVLSETIHKEPSLRDFTISSSHRNDFIPISSKAAMWCFYQQRWECTMWLILPLWLLADNWWVKTWLPHIKYLL